MLQRRCKPLASPSPSILLRTHLLSPYAINRYLNETKRLYGVLDKQLEGKEYILGTYGIADIKIYGWARFATRLGIDLNDFSNVKAWIERIDVRPAVKAGVATATPPPSA